MFSSAYFEDIIDPFDNTNRSLDLECSSKDLALYLEWVELTDTDDIGGGIYFPPGFESKLAIYARAHELGSEDVKRHIIRIFKSEDPDHSQSWAMMYRAAEIDDVERARFALDRIRHERRMLIGADATPIT